MNRDDLKTTDWEIRLAGGDTVSVAAAYWSLDEGTKWFEFKNTEHKCVFAVAEKNVYSVSRA